MWAHSLLLRLNKSNPSYVIKDLAKSGEILSSQQSPFLSGCIYNHSVVEKWGTMKWNMSTGIPPLTWPSELSAKNVFFLAMKWRARTSPPLKGSWNGHLNDKTPSRQCCPKVPSHLETKYWKALQVEINLIERLYAG